MSEELYTREVGSTNVWIDQMLNTVYGTQKKRNVRNFRTVGLQLRKLKIEQTQVIQQFSMSKLFIASVCFSLRCFKIVYSLHYFAQ